MKRPHSVVYEFVLALVGIDALAGCEKISGSDRRRVLFPTALSNFPSTPSLLLHPSPPSLLLTFSPPSPLLPSLFFAFFFPLLSPHRLCFFAIVMAYNPVANPAEPTPRLASFEEETLQPPAGFRDSGNFRDSYGAPSNASFDSAQPFGAGAANMPYRDDPNSSANILNKEDTGYPPSPPMEHGSAASRKKKSPVPWIIAGVAGLAIVVVAVVVPIYFTVIKKNNDTAASQSDHAGHNSGSNSGSNNGDDTGTTKAAITGADGSTVTMEDGTTFTYSNKFGGFWVQDPDDPFNGNAQAQSWSPPLNQSWDWQNNKIRG